MRRALLPGLLLLLLAGGCVRRPAAPVVAHYVVGPGYQASGTWFYPREDFQYSATGLAVVQPDRRGATADGETIDPSALTASHQTLQLPAIAMVTNLETGLQVSVRVNDRGPDTPKRLIGLSRRAGELLGIPVGAVVPVRVELDETLSQALHTRLQGGPALAMTMAPRTAVSAQALPPPPGIGQSARGRSVGATLIASQAVGASVPSVPDRMPETVQRVMAGHGPLMIEAGIFGQMGYARAVAAKLDARVERIREGRSERYAVKAGPFSDVAAADAALDRAMRAGVTDARIVVE